MRSSTGDAEELLVPCCISAQPAKRIKASIETIIILANFILIFLSIDRVELLEVQRYA
jgi:hypothetical protein